MRAENVDVVRDDVHYLQMTFNAAPEEFAGFMDELKVLVQRMAERGPAKNRVQRTLSIITLPEKPGKAN